MKKEEIKSRVLDYYFRYFPSKKKVYDKIFSYTKKDIAFTGEIFLEIEHLLQERQNVEARVRYYISRNKSKSYIISHLLQKGYEKEFILESISLLSAEKDGKLFDEHFLIHKAQAYKDKGKSRLYTLAKLQALTQDVSLGETIIGQVFGEQGELENLQYEFEKLKGKFETKKIIEKLLRKGFSYDSIKKLF